MSVPPNNHQNKYASHYARRGERVTHRIASAIARKSWRWTIINLAWTVGPVTFIALQFGHYLGFGNQAPLQNFYYFAGYTLIAGAFALVASILHDALYKPRIDQEQEQLLEAIDRLHHLMMTTRDHILQQLDLQERKIMSAYYILQSVGASPSAVETAVFDLTNSSELTSAARRSHVFAEQGMQSRVDDIYHEYKAILEPLRNDLQANAAQAYELLEQRLQGMSPSIRVGLERGEGFIERVLTAAEENDDNKMTLYDVLDVLALAFELINGRHIAVLDARLKGDDNFERAQETLDEARHHYRMAIRRRNSQIRLLAEALYAEAELDLVVEATDATSRFIAAIEKGITQLPDQKRLSFRAPYERILRLNEQVSICRERFLRAEADYTRTWREHGERLTLAMQSDDLQQAGFYIEERSISLTDKQRLKLVHTAQNLLSIEFGQISKETLKQLAMVIASELDDMIDMSQPEEQLAVESSNVTDFGYITKGLAPATKAGWASIAIDAMHENRRKPAHRLARNLMVFYRVPLTQSIIELFVEQFGAEEEYLRQLNHEVSTIGNLSSAGMPPAPPRLLEWNQLCHIQPRSAHA